MEPHLDPFQWLSGSRNILEAKEMFNRHGKCQKVYTDRILKGKILPQTCAILNTRHIAIFSELLTSNSTIINFLGMALISHVPISCPI